MDNRNNFRDHLHEVIFEADTPAGKLFDVWLLILIIASITVVLLESVPSLKVAYGNWFFVLEWVLTALFTLEYILRLYCVSSPLRYARSFFGIVDLLSILPTYLSLFFAGTHGLMVIRALRLLRVFRIFKLGHFMMEGQYILNALKASRAKISVFVFFVVVMITIMGSIMYLVEAPERGGNPGFNSIPNSIYWAVVTLTTVGYGDIAPATPLGKFISAIVMILGYAVIAVPTGIVTSEIITADKKSYSKHSNTQACRNCSLEGHDADAEYCKYCGHDLND